ncbi:flagellar motor protein MotB [Sphingomonas solaris]|uniref:OmpA family protein n=1 Tax=Alterirhizorhabdus solaris TaxID=2529389 RepID=A0A558QV48_9SPHN|nr:flagellar motor protein MotB [Sphingomonas solaris]TVV70932.1 OmpA family protein [Sphingomonas solaris]
MASKAATPAKRGKNEPEIRPIIVKKIIAEGHGGHHGGAWKVAYADFVTAMMAFFLLMWILGATDEKQRKGIADYFTPTLVEMRQKSAGSNGPFGGDSLMAKENYPHKAAQTGTKSITIPKDATGGEKGRESMRQNDRARFTAIKKKLVQAMKKDKGLAKLLKNVRFTDTREGLRIDLVDQSDFAMFGVGGTGLLPDARRLMGEVAKVIAAVPNDVIVRGHTDALPYAAGRSTNNWSLSSNRAEATRAALAAAGVPATRFARIEGVADREPFIPGDIYDPRNRRMSITLKWSGPDGGEGEGADKGAGAAAPADVAPFARQATPAH